MSIETAKEIEQLLAISELDHKCNFFLIIIKKL